MPITALPVNQLKQDNYAVQAGDLTVAQTAMDAVNGNSFVATGKEILVIQNNDAAPHTFTITSVPDTLGRSDASLTNYSVPATTLIALQMNQLAGWLQSSDGTVHMTTSSALLKITVLRFN
jgi:hypothetical protein